jgi:NADPH-dependent 7-cyano-7-deazaguanine reductase QueF
MSIPQIETVSSIPGVRMTITSPIIHLCPFKDEVDTGSITVSWETHHGTIELHSLRAFFDSYAESEISHEGLTDTIRRELNRIPSIKALSVATSWNTAGMSVAVST